MDRLHSISQKVSLLVMGGTSLLMAVVIVAGIAGTEWCSRLTGRRGYVVSSGSMEPTIGTGSFLVVRLLGPIARQSVKVGDVITFRAGESRSTLVTHRVVATEISNGTSTYTTKGDANPAADAARVPADDVVGTQVLDVPYLGYAIDSMHRVPVSASFTGAFLLASVALRSGGDGDREDRKEKRRRQEG